MHGRTWMRQIFSFFFFLCESNSVFWGQFSALQTMGCGESDPIAKYIALNGHEAILPQFKGSA